MAHASVIVAWVILLFKTVAVIACTIVVLCLFWAILSRRASQKKNDDLG